MRKTALPIGASETVGSDEFRATIKRDAKGYTIKWADGHSTRRYTYRTARATAEGRYLALTPAPAPAPAPALETPQRFVRYRVDGGEPIQLRGRFDSDTDARAMVIQTINLLSENDVLTLVGFSDGAIAVVVRGHSYEFTIDE